MTEGKRINRVAMPPETCRHGASPGIQSPLFMPQKIPGSGAAPRLSIYQNLPTTKSPKATTAKEPKNDHSVEIPKKSYDPNSEISHDINPARNTPPRQNLPMALETPLTLLQCGD